MFEDLFASMAMLSAYLMLLIISPPIFTLLRLSVKASLNISSKYKFTSVCVYVLVSRLSSIFLGDVNVLVLMLPGCNINI